MESACYACLASCLELIREICDGATSCGRGLAFVISSPRVLRTCVFSAPFTWTVVIAQAFFVWIIAYPMRLWTREFLFDDALRIALLLSLIWQRYLWPRFGFVARGPFLATLELYDESLYLKVEAAPIVQGFMSLMPWLLTRFLAMIVIIAISLFAAPLLAILLAPWLLVMRASTLVLLIIATSLLLVTSVLALPQPSVTLSRFVDPIFATVALIMLIVGVCNRASFERVVKMGILLHLSSTILTRQLLYQFSQCTDLDTWTEFTTRHRWRILGFGLPVWVLISWQPVVAIVMLEAFHGAAAVLLADLLIVDEGSDQAPGRSKSVWLE